MSTAKFTPGPWLVAGHTVYAGEGWNRFSTHVQPGFDNQRNRISDQEVEANAHLIAAAPDLFAAVGKLIECAEMCAAQCRVDGDTAHATMYQSYVDSSCAAIAKAEGWS